MLLRDLFYESRVGTQTFPSENLLIHARRTAAAFISVARSDLRPHASLQSFGLSEEDFSIHPFTHPSIQRSYLSHQGPQPPSTDSPAAGGNASGSSGRCVFVFRGRSPGRGEALAPLRPFLQYFSLRLRTVLKFYLFPPRTPRWVCGCASWWWSAIRQACLELIDSTLLKNLIRKILPTTCGLRLPTHSTASLAGE